jgi:hypothetical protein
VIENPDSYGSCDSGEVSDRPPCAIRTYQVAVADAELMNNGANGTSMTWDLFIALTIAGEGGIFYINPELESNKPFEMEFSPDLATFRTLFESAIYRQLVAACDGASCTEADFVKFLAGPPFNQWGIEAWYSLAFTNVDQTIARLKGRGTVLYTNFIDNAQTRLSGDVDERVIRWGNPQNFDELNTAVAYASYIDATASYGRVNPDDEDRVYFWIK